MTAPRLIVGVALVLGIGFGGLAIFLHRQNERVRNRIVDLRQRGRPAEQLRRENERLRALLQTVTREGGATDAIHAEAERARGAVAELEKRAELRHVQLTAQAASDEHALANNRDPNVGLARLEHFQDVGQATPRAAVQTLVWAALKGDDAALGRLLVLSDSTRARAEALIAELPEDSRVRWTPEKLVALYFSAVVTDVSAAQIASENIDQPRHAIVALRIPGVEAAKAKIELRATAAGWQVIAPEDAIDVVRRRVAPPGK
jgi:hypothetical protein